MRDLDTLNKYKIELYGSMGDKHNGAFIIPIGNKEAFIIASNGMNWEHVSVSIKGVERCPKWDEMCQVKSMFFNDDEVVMQLHPKKSEYVNNHNYCLHLWKPIGEEIPTPPSIMVGIK